MASRNDYYKEPYCPRFLRYAERPRKLMLRSIVVANMSSSVRKEQHDDLEKVGPVASTDVGIVPKSAEEKRLVRKIDLYLMPSIWVLYLLAVSLP